MFVRLPPTDAAPAGRVGCLLVLAAVLLAIGGGIVFAYVAHPAGKGDMWVMPVVGGGFALVGALLLYAGVRGARGLKIPEPEVFIDDGVPLLPGAVVQLRLRQRGPMTVDSLQLRVCCERLYERQVRANSSATVEDRELLWEQLLAEVKDERIAAGAVLEREVTLRLPADARPTGPATADGTIRWQVEVRGEAGFMRATHRAFEIRVAPFGGAAPSALDAASLRGAARTADDDAGGDEAQQHRPANRRRFRPSGRAGMLVIGLGFVIPAAFFLWAFFSGAAFSGRGNPYMALVGGLLFGGIGLLMLALGVLSFLPAPGADRKRRR
jgi:hypothetical protein